MNKDNIKKAIAVMERAKVRDSVYMTHWQMALADLGIADNEETFHACGNKACFAGHIAVSPEFQADGGSVHWDGAPIFKGVDSAGAVAMWLEIDDLTAMGLM